MGSLIVALQVTALGVDKIQYQRPALLTHKFY